MTVVKFGKVIKINKTNLEKETLFKISKVLLKFNYELIIMNKTKFKS